MARQRTMITKKGQPYVDEPVYAMPRPITALEESLAKAFGRRLAEPVQLGYKRVRLRWMKPDGKGGLVPR